MYSTLVSIALFASVAIQGVQSFAINSPDLILCKSTKLSWEPTKGPYNIAVMHANDTCGDVVVDLGDTDKTYLVWSSVANLTEGEKYIFSVLDADDNEAITDPIAVVAGDCKSSSETETASAPGSTYTAPANAAGTIPTSSPPSAPSDSAVPVGASADGILGDSDSGALASVPLGFSTLALGVVVAALGLSL